MPISPSYPGVYVTEVSSGIRTITSASTSIAAFLGVAEKGPIGVATKISNFTEYQNLFGGYDSALQNYLPLAVYYYFLNGGSSCYVLRIAGLNHCAASITLNDRATTQKPSIRISANSQGKWGNKLVVEIKDSDMDPDNAFDVILSKETDQKDKFVQLETFANCSMHPSSPRHVKKVVSDSKYIAIEVLEHSVTQGIFQSGAFGKTEVCSFKKDDPALFQIKIDDDNYQVVDIWKGVKDGAKAEDENVPNLDTMTNIAKAIAYVVNHTMQKMKISTSDNAYSNFTCEYKNDQLILKSGSTSNRSCVQIAPFSGCENVIEKLKFSPKFNSKTILGSSIGRPCKNTTDIKKYFMGDHVPGGAVVSVVEGDDGADVTNIIQTDFNALNSIDEISLITAPGFATFEQINAGMNYCKNRPLQDCFFIGDIGCSEDEVDLTDVNTVKVGFYNSLNKDSYGAVYGPWIIVNNPFVREKDLVAVPPSGFIAGLYGKTDTARGVWKAPAGTAVTISGAIGLSVNLTDQKQGDLNNIHINCIRSFPSYGFTVWGARTMTSPDDTEWKYIPVRRMAIFLRVSIYRGIQWVVFEPNDTPLWSSIRLCITSFMTDLFRKGAFAGKSPSEAFFVKCDSETTTQNDINQGIVNVTIGFAPLRPAEFVIVTLSQKAGGHN